MRTNKMNKRITTLILVCCLLLAAQPALAYLHSASDTISNILSRRGKPDVSIDEVLGATKQVRITNSGEAPTRVEVRVSVVYRSNTNAMDALPATGVQFTGSDPNWTWTGYYALWGSNLHQHESTGWLFTNVTADPPPAGYHLEVKVIAHNESY